MMRNRDFFTTSSIPSTALFMLVLMTLCGCGTAKVTNTGRTATEQLLISDAMDRAVNQIDFSAVAGQDIYLDTTAIASLTDAKYFISLLRQHALASGCHLFDDKTKAKYIVEIRAGSIGTDQNDTVFGLTATTIPSLFGNPAMTIPEMSVAKKQFQKAVVKLGVFAYSVETNQPVWQSGNIQSESTAKSRWLFGMGPYQTGSIFDNARFDGSDVKVPVINKSEGGVENISLTAPVFYESASLEAQRKAAEEAKKAEEVKKAAEAAAKKAEEDKKAADAAAAKKAEEEKKVAEAKAAEEAKKAAEAQKAAQATTAAAPKSEASKATETVQAAQAAQPAVAQK